MTHLEKLIKDHGHLAVADALEAAAVHAEQWTEKTSVDCADMWTCPFSGWT